MTTADDVYANRKIFQVKKIDILLHHSLFQFICTDHGT